MSVYSDLRVLGLMEQVWSWFEDRAYTIFSALILEISWEEKQESQE